jgi:hypothetical protein
MTSEDETDPTESKFDDPDTERADEIRTGEFTDKVAEKAAGLRTDSLPPTMRFDEPLVTPPTIKVLEELRLEPNSAADRMEQLEPPTAPHVKENVEPIIACAFVDMAPPTWHWLPTVAFPPLHILDQVETGPPILADIRTERSLLKIKLSVAEIDEDTNKLRPTERLPERDESFPT